MPTAYNILHTTYCVLLQDTTKNKGDPKVSSYYKWQMPM